MFKKVLNKISKRINSHRLPKADTAKDINNDMNNFDWGGATLTVFAGSVPGYQDDVGELAKFKDPIGLAIDPRTDDIYVADSGNMRIRKISPDGTVTTVAGDGTRGNKDGLATEATFDYAVELALDHKRDMLYIVEMNLRTIRTLNLKTNNISSFSPTSSTPGFYLGSPTGIAVNCDTGNLLLVDSTNPSLCMINPATGETQILLDKSCKFAPSYPRGVAYDPVSKNIFLTVVSSNLILKYSPDGEISQYCLGQDPPISHFGLCIDSLTGTLYSTDSGQASVVAIPREGQYKVIASGNPLTWPLSAVVDSLGNVYVADHSKHAIYKISNLAPRKWSIDTHKRLPLRFQKKVKTLLMIRQKIPGTNQPRYPNSFLYLLPVDIFYEIVRHLLVAEYQLRVT